MELATEIGFIRKEALKLVAYCETLEKKLKPKTTKKGKGDVLSADKVAKLKMNVRSITVKK